MKPDDANPELLLSTTVRGGLPRRSGMSIAESAPGKAPLPCVPALTVLPALQGPCSAAPGSELLMTGAGLSVSAAPPEAQCLSSAQRGDDELGSAGGGGGGNGASETAVCKHVTRRPCENADSDSAGLGLA